MPERDWRLFAEDILESVELIDEYIEGMEFDDFKQDSKTIDAVARNFEIIGEASKYIPADIKEKYQNVDWRGIVGFKDRVSSMEYRVLSPLPLNSKLRTLNSIRYAVL